jgi:hypothetical protein
VSTLASKETSEVGGVDDTVAISVNSVVGSRGGVVIPECEVLLQVVNPSLESELILDNSGEGTVNVNWELIVTTDSGGIPVLGAVSQVVVFAREQHLEEPRQNKLDFGKNSGG